MVTGPGEASNKATRPPSVVTPTTHANANAIAIHARPLHFFSARQYSAVRYVPATVTVAGKRDTFTRLSRPHEHSNAPSRPRLAEPTSKFFHQPEWHVLQTRAPAWRRSCAQCLTKRSTPQ